MKRAARVAAADSKEPIDPSMWGPAERDDSSYLIEYNVQSSSKLTDIDKGSFRIQVVASLVVNCIDADRIKDDVETLAFLGVEITFEHRRQVFALVVDRNVRIEAADEIFRSRRCCRDHESSICFGNLDGVGSNSSTSTIDENSLSSTVFQAA